jgi:hypothetical protein
MWFIRMLRRIMGSPDDLEQHGFEDEHAKAHARQTADSALRRVQLLEVEANITLRVQPTYHDPGER